ncbi:MAG TPA: prephenate dehydrogenase/arogenate dehydrogenase family protein [Gemmatimonadaceae bacterium]
MSSKGTVAVIGLGMIGGSVARALAARGKNVVGYDTNSSYVDAAIAEGVLSQRLPPALDDLLGADTVVIAVYGDAAIDVLHRVAHHASSLRLVTDTGSTKRSIVKAAADTAIAECFVGSHPFAGDHRSGWSASRFDLFEGEIVYLCPGGRTSEASLKAARDLWASIEAKPVPMDAGEHDDLLAWTSHLPHLLSCSFALALAQAGIAHRQLGRGGRDVARLAAGSPDVWTAIALDNSEAIISALSSVERQIATIRESIRGADSASIRDRLAHARDWSGPPR